MSRIADIGAAVIGTGFIGTVHVEAAAAHRRPGPRRPRQHAGAWRGPGRRARRRARLRLARGDPRRPDRRRRPRHLAQPPPRPAGAGDPRGRQARRLREAAGDDGGRVGRARRDAAARAACVNAVNFNIRFYPLHQHVREIVADGDLGDVRLRDRPLLPGLAAPRHRLELAARARQGRRAAGGRRHRLALDRPDASSSPASGSSSVMADLATFVDAAPRADAGRSRRSRRSAPPRRSTRADGDRGRRDDPAPLRERRPRLGRGLARSAPAARTRSSGRSTAPTSAAAWDSETPDHLWLGHRDRPNEILLRNPALMGAAGRAAAALPGGHVEGFGDTFGALFRAIYADVVAGRPSDRPAVRDVRRRPRRDARQRRDRRERRAGRWVDVDRAPVPSAGAGVDRPGGDRPMKLGLLTAPFPDTPLMDVADWAAANGFEILEIACWPRPTGPTPALRRHVATSTSRTCPPARRATSRAEIEAKGLAISGPRLLPEPAPSGPGPSRRRSSAT